MLCHGHFYPVVGVIEDEDDLQDLEMLFEAHRFRVCGLGFTLKPCEFHGDTSNSSMLIVGVIIQVMLLRISRALVMYLCFR